MTVDFCDKDNIYDLIVDLYQDANQDAKRFNINKNISKCKTFAHPIHFEYIKNKLSGQYDTENVRDYLLFSKKRSDYFFYETYMKLLKVPEFIPDEEYLPLNFWVEPKSVTRKLDAATFSALKGFSRHSIIFWGEKGSGKTMTINCWLATRHKQLNDQKILWLYADGYKLYQIWNHPHADENKLVTVENFFLFKLVYIIAKYNHRSAFLQGIYNLLKEEKNTEFIHKDGMNYKLLDLIDFLNKLSENIQRHEKLHKNQVGIDAYYYTYMLAEFQKRSTFYGKGTRKWLALGEKIRSILIEKGYNLLYILDGVDNINLEIETDQGKLLYENALDETARFIFSVATEGTINLLVTRERTWIEMTKRYNVPPDYSNSNFPIKIPNEQQDFILVNQKRLLYFFEGEKRIKFQREFNRSKLYHFIKSVLEIYQNLNNPLLTGYFYHNNVSNYLHNTFSLFLFLYYRWLQQGQPPLDQYDFRAHIFLYYTRNLLLNGEFFLNSRIEGLNQAKAGRFSHSLFYVDYDTSREDPLHLLFNVRILQALDQQERLSDDDLYQKLNHYFDYSKELIRRGISSCREYGLIDTLLDPYTGDVFLSTSAKGKQLLQHLFSDVDLLYALALDAYLPRFFFDKNKEFVMGYNNKLPAGNTPIKTNYATGAIITTVSFLTFIFYVNYLEEQKLKSLSEADFLLQKFSLPIGLDSIKSLSDRYFELYRTASDKEKDALAKFCNRLK